MTSERRNDIGNKVLIAVVSLLVTTIIGVSIVTASKAMDRTQNNEVKITKLEVFQLNALEDIKEIKADVKTLVVMAKR